MLYRRRNTLRLGGWDYSDPGDYYITICTYQRACFLSTITNGAVTLSQSGVIVQQWWQRLPGRYRFVSLGPFVIMPNHLHGIIRLEERREGQARRPLSDVVRWFKAVSRQYVNQDRHTPYLDVWQRSYYDHIVRDFADYARIEAYILDNPANWENDRLSPGHPNPFPFGRGG